MIATSFGLVEFDLLATHTGASIPFPLRVPSFGRIPGERQVLFTTAGATLRHRALADENGPTGLAGELAAALARRRGTLDLVLTGSAEPVGVAAVVHRDRVLLCRQTLDDTRTAMVDVRHLPLDGVVDALHDLIPPLPAAKIMPLRVPVAAVRAVHETGAAQLHRIASRHGCAVEDLDALVRAGGTVVGGGQLGACAVSDHGPDVRLGTELSWLDSPGGRMRVTTHHGWLSVNPLRPNDLHTAIAELVTLIKHPPR